MKDPRCPDHPNDCMHPWPHKPAPEPQQTPVLTTEQVRMDFAYLGGYSREAEYDERIAEFDRWLAGIKADLRSEIAGAIWEDEQKANAALNGANPGDPLAIHMNGRAMGLQRARDIAEGGAAVVTGAEPKEFATPLRDENAELLQVLREHMVAIIGSEPEWQVGHWAKRCLDMINARKVIVRD